MVASPHPIDGIAKFIADRPLHRVGIDDVRWESMKPTFKFVLKDNLITGPARPIERVDPVRPTSRPGAGGVKKKALYMTAGAPVMPIRFMGQDEEIRRIIVRLSLKWNDYLEGHALAVEINRYLFKFGIDKRIPPKLPKVLVPPLRRFMPVNNNPSPNDILNKHILDFHALNSEPILSGPFGPYNYFAMNYSVDYVTGELE